MRITLPLMLLFEILAAAPARADQCAWNSREVADRAVARLRQVSETLLFCEPCDETAPTRVEVRDVKVVPVSNGQYFEVVLNGEGIDLAYIFVPESGGQQYVNLGRALECGASGVSRSITYPYKKPTGLYRDWFGKWRRLGGPSEVTLRINKQKLHGDHWLALRFNLISGEWGDNRGELTGYLHMDEERPVYVTPFAGCHLFFALKGSELEVTDTPQCGALGGSITGRYRPTGKRRR